MSHQSMSINKILLPTITSQSFTLDKTAKVKIFYTFNGSQKHCLCSFDMKLSEENIKEKKWMSVPLKQCLISLCSSCPDQLIYKDAAVYSANFEENATVENWSPLHDATSNIVWEGHGLLSSLMNDNAQQYATGKIIESNSNDYICQVEVLIQLQPVQPHILPTSPQSENYQLPPMRSLWNTSETVNWQRNDVFSSVQKQPEQSINYPPALNRNWPGSRYDANSFVQEEDKRKHQEILNIPKKKMKQNTTMTIRSITSTGTTDTYFHQSRRKKRDTKPPNANDIRPFIEVQKDNDGHYILPAEVDSWTVLDLGTVVWDRAAFHNQRYIYPVGYRVKKWYRSMIDPHSDTQYTCEILDGGEEPIFQLNADDNPTECWRGPTPTTVWTIVVRRAFAIRNMDYGHNPVGPDFFGLRKNTIAKMIQDLPNANKCQNYIWQNFEATNNTKGKSVRRSSTRINLIERPLLKSIEDPHPSSSSCASSPHTDNEA
ncbi:hypothetical protein G6F29_004126 [Rhizopus arrhizus]|uniref:Transforming growth factor beta regulator 1 n=1 Tax=Rhizopus oryzae TaxID=64495 RepID=A0A9P6XCR7_RHIOR|nr:hypothetical protein G6F23_001137 [Rhizopus arrhizus]KAG0764607.1 hypothetical protein G6F24_005086 [Rhizopus arrhizus]KAG0786748.1 hypothetical protein G6F21_008376 [Rhizopus arrhizus]KAG0809191.1 hypothetical protein G6F20_008969 [Rhizopus arrhizus]KAG0828114.1 hypothetical protein G6F18_009222 [Rhizopus arrhizus]